MQNTQESLEAELERRKLEDTSYSVRRFAQDLGIPRSTLFDILSGKREASSKNIKILKSLFPHLEFENSKTKRLNFTLLKEEEFTTISDWEYMAILNLAKIPDHQACPKWVSQRLGLSMNRARKCLDDLIAHEYIEVSNNKITRLSAPITTSTDISSSTIKKHHIQAINLAEDALFSTPIEQREFLSGTLAIDESNLSQMKDEIFEVYKKFSKKYDGINPSQVYKLNIQFFPCMNTEP